MHPDLDAAISLVRAGAIAGGGGRSVAAALRSGRRDSRIPTGCTLKRGSTPLLLSMPHAGIGSARASKAACNLPWLARKDADWYVPELYDFATELDATIVRTDISRTVIDVNRDPTGAVALSGPERRRSLCPTTTFDGEPLYRRRARADRGGDSRPPSSVFRSVSRRRCVSETERLLKQHPRVVVYDCHSIRSEVPRLFEGLLPHFNIGTNSGKSCAPALADRRRARSARHSATQRRAERPLQGRLHHPQPRRARGRACTPSRWSSRRAATCAKNPGRSPSRTGRLPTNETHAAPTARRPARHPEALRSFALTGLIRNPSCPESMHPALCAPLVAPPFPPEAGRPKRRCAC